LKKKTKFLKNWGPLWDEKTLRARRDPLVELTYEPGPGRKGWEGRGQNRTLVEKRMG